MGKGPVARGFTVAERKALRFEQVTMWLVLLVAVIAGVVSFQALTDAGLAMNLRWAAPLLPLSIDGFAVACSVGIIRSQAAGQKSTKRISEWLGLAYALAVSILGNAYHVLNNGYPDWLKVVMAASIPFIVAYGIHVYGRAMSTGLSAYVMVDNPDELVFDVRHLGDEPTAHRAPARTPRPAHRAPQAARPAAQAARTEGAQVAKEPRAQAVSRTAVPGDDEKARARVIFDRMVADNPLAKPDAAAIMREIGSERHPATPRRWVKDWWDEHEASLGMGREEKTGPQIGAESVEAATA